MKFFWDLVTNTKIIGLLTILGCIGTYLFGIFAVPQVQCFVEPVSCPKKTSEQETTTPTGTKIPSSTFTPTLPNLPTITDIPAEPTNTQLPTEIVLPTVTEVPPSAQTESDENAIVSLLDAECNALINQDVNLINEIYSDDAVLINEKGTPSNASDDTIYSGLDVIRGHYLGLLFPQHPTNCKHTNIKVNTGDNTAFAISGSIYRSTVSNACNLWEFRKINNQWKITKLTYNIK